MDYKQKKLLSVKSDYIFKLIFGDQRNVDILADFLKSFLDIPEEEYDHLTVIDPHVKKELVTEQMSSGQDYSIVKRVVSIIIADENFVTGDKYHNQFRYRTEDGIEFTNLIEINTLELKKLPPYDDSTDLWHWMKFIKSEYEEVMDMLAQRNQSMRKAVGVLKELSADERTRMLYEQREMARMDMESRMDGAEQKGLEKGRAEIARNLLKMNLPVDQIITATGLTRDELDKFM